MLVIPLLSAALTNGFLHDILSDTQFGRNLELHASAALCVDMRKNNGAQTFTLQGGCQLPFSDCSCCQSDTGAPQGSQPGEPAGRGRRRARGRQEFSSLSAPELGRAGVFHIFQRLQFRKPMSADLGAEMLSYSTKNILTFGTSNTRLALQMHEECQLPDDAHH